MRYHQKSSKIESENHINRVKFETYNTNIHDLLLSWLSTVISIKRYGIRLVLEPRTSRHIQLGEQHCCNEGRIHILTNIIILRDTLEADSMNNTMSIKDSRWHQPSFKSYIVYKATGRHRMGTMFNIEPIFNS